MSAHSIDIYRRVTKLTADEQRDFDAQRDFPVPVRAEPLRLHWNVPVARCEAQERTKRPESRKLRNTSSTPAAGNLILPTKLMRSCAMRWIQVSPAIRLGWFLLPTRGPISGTRIIHGQATGAADVASGDVADDWNERANASQTVQPVTAGETAQILMGGGVESRHAARGSEGANSRGEGNQARSANQPYSRSSDRPAHHSILAAQSMNDRNPTSDRRGQGQRVAATGVNVAMLLVPSFILSAWRNGVSGATAESVPSVSHYEKVLTARRAGSNPAALNPIHTRARLNGWLIAVALCVSGGVALGWIWQHIVTP